MRDALTFYATNGQAIYRTLAVRHYKNRGEQYMITGTLNSGAFHAYIHHQSAQGHDALGKNPQHGWYKGTFRSGRSFSN